MNDPKVFELGVGNDLGISYKWYDFGAERSRLGLRLTAVWHRFKLLSAILLAA